MPSRACCRNDCQRWSGPVAVFRHDCPRWSLRLWTCVAPVVWLAGESSSACQQRQVVNRVAVIRAGQSNGNGLDRSGRGFANQQGAGRHNSGGGGNRTRVPEWLRASFYVCSLLLWPYRKSVVPFRSGRSSRRDQPVANRPWLPPAVPPVAAAGGLTSIAEIRSPSGKAHGSGLRCRVRQPERSALRHFGFGRLFTWPTDQPRHATDAFAHPVEASSPPGCSALIYARHRPLVNKIFIHGVQGRDSGE